LPRKGKEAEVFVSFSLAFAIFPIDDEENGLRMEEW